MDIDRHHFSLSRISDQYESSQHAPEFECDYSLVECSLELCQVFQMDVLTKKQRSLNMSRIKGKNTKPELLVRSLLHRLGFRFRLHRKDLPGSPDIVFPGKKSVIFVHGCYWHRHNGCPKATTPSTNTNFWKDKFEKNVKRDKKAKQELKRLGWNVLVVWECELKEVEVLIEKLTSFLDTKN